MAQVAAGTGGGTAAASGAGAVVHFHSHTDVVHQGRHGVDLRGAAARGERRGHVGPVIGGGAEVGTLGAIRAMRVGVRTITNRGMVPEFHHLSGGGGHTSGHRLGRVGVVVRAEVVVVRALVPCGGHQRVDRGRERRVGHPAVQQAVPLFANIGRTAELLLSVVLTVEGDLFVVHLHPVFHVGGNLLRDKRVGQRVTQDGHHAVVSRDKDESLALVEREDVKLFEWRLRRHISEVCERASAHPL